MHLKVIDLKSQQNEIPFISSMLTPSLRIHDTFATKKENKLKAKCVMQEMRRPMLEQFHPICQSYIEDVVDVVADGHYRYRCIAAFFWNE